LNWEGIWSVCRLVQDDNTSCSGLRVDDVDLEEPMFRNIPPVPPSTTRPVGKSRPTPSSSTRSAGQSRPVPTTLRKTALRPVPSITGLRQSRPGSTTMRAQSTIPPTRPSTAQSRPIRSTTRNTGLSTKPKPISVPVPAPVADDLFHLMEDLPIPELSLDFGFDNCIL
jgi:hypothetical protein